VKSTRNYLILVLTIIVVGGGALAWQQYQELVALRAAALSGDDRAGLQKKLWDAEKRARELEAQLAAVLGGESGPADATAAAGTDPTTAAGARGGRGRMANLTPAQQAALQALMQNPQVQSLLAQQQRAALAARYAPLIKNLNLSPEQGDKLIGLIADSQGTRQDAMAAARAAGITPQSDPQGFQKMLADAQAQSDANMKSALGDTTFAAVQQYNQTVPQRTLVNQLQQQLALSTPMTPDQSEQLIQILAASAPQGGGGGGGGRGFGGGGFGGGGGGFGAMAALAGGGGGFGGGGGGFGGGGGGGFGGAQITQAAITQAQSVLAPAQVQALQQLQQAQQVQRQVQQIMGGRGGGGGRRGGGAAAAGGN
jgi:hypothetical protein